MLVFLLHGYPDGPIVYSSYVSKLLEENHIPIVINTRTGISVHQNKKLVQEVLDSYPSTAPKVIIAHDWGAVVAWRLLKYFNGWNVQKFVCLSVGYMFRPEDRRPLLYKSYQFMLWMSRLFPSCLSMNLQHLIVDGSNRQSNYDTPRSAYYYSGKYAMGSWIGVNKSFCGLDDLNNCNTHILFITTEQDMRLGFAPWEVLQTLVKRGDIVIRLMNMDHFILKEYDFISPIICDFLE
jgi:pimeloyl-ACP methyl ester carboxylesterase